MSSQISIPDHILFEDQYVLVINKPAGLMVEPDRNNHPNLLQQVKRYLFDKTGEKEIYAQHIHRLDRPVSGIILFAKKREVLKNLSEQFAERKVKKFYIAMTDSEPKERKGIIEHWHRKEKKKATLYNEEVQWSERARLNYEIINFTETGKYYWNIELHTGKFHQIRAQLASISCPIVGDFLYGSTTNYKENCIALHAYRLIFFHPIDNKEIEILSKADFVQ